MLYTSYISNIKNIPDNFRKIIIMRYVPKSLKDPKYDLEWMPSLAPSEILLNNYKNNKISFTEFKDRFIEELMFRKDLQDDLKSIVEDLQNGNDVCLICCEKDYLDCHRTIVKNHIDNVFNMSGGGEL